MEENITPQAEVSQSSWLQKVDPRTNVKGVLILLVVIILFGGAIAWNSTKDSSKEGTEQQKQSTQTKFLAENSVVYGYWVNKNSVIEAIDLSTSTNSTLAVLPNNIKQVSVVSDDNLIFIKDTDSQDYGKSIVSYRISDGTENVISSADQGYGIDLYVVSPNGKYIAIWEISPAPNTSILSGGNSRVYSVDVSKPGSKNLIYDESAPVGIAVHYPVGITNNGEVYMDKFLPNSGVGWAYGMSMSNFTGSVKSEIASMVNGTYATIPAISPDGTKLVFVGYDGSRGDGKDIVDGRRRALISSNTIDILDLSTQQRKKVISASNNAIFNSAYWDLTTGDIWYTVISPVTNSFDTYKYSFDIGTSKRIDFKPKETSNSVEVVKTSLSGGDLLVASLLTSDSAIGNLGSRYEQSLNGLYMLNPQNQKRVTVNLGGAYVQFIDLKGAEYFKTANLALKGSKQNNKGQQGSQLQLETFVLKPSLAPVRIEQLSQPRPGPTTPPEDIQSCSEQMQAGCSALEGSENTTCMVNAASCNHSPLYLYGPLGTKVDVKVGVPLYSPNVSYNSEVGFEVTLGTNGNLIVNGRVADSLSFDYTTGIKKLTRPIYGKVVENSKLKQAIQEYAQKLGFNQRETEDSMTFAKEITSPYVYVSFYDDVLSKKILPLYFSPQPDTYRNIVFYFEQFESKPNLKPFAPVFEPIKRVGFTAIEISFILR